MTHLINNTSISTDLIKAILIDAGYDLNAGNNLEIEYSTKFKGAIKDNMLGGCWATEMNGIQTIFVKLAPWANTFTLAHELRHAYQFQNLGNDLMYLINDQENNEVGYGNNALEVDANEFAKRWKV